MKLRHYTYYELVRRPGRTLLTLLGIVIGVGGVFAISLTVNTTRGAYRQMFADLTGRASLEVVAEGGGGFDPSILSEITSVPGIRSAEPTVQMFGGIVTGLVPLPVMVVGTDANAGELAAGRLVSGRRLAADDEILLVESFSRSLKLAENATVRLLSRAGGRAFHVVGLVEATGIAGFNGGVAAGGARTVRAGESGHRDSTGARRPGRCQ